MDSRNFSFRQLLASLLAFPVFVAMSGCVVIPTSAEGGFDKKEELIQALIGTSITDVRSQLGEPGNTYELADATYLLYRRDGNQKWFSLAHPLAMIWYQFPVQWGSAELVQCLLIESKHDEVVDAKVKSFSDITGAALHMTSTRRSCTSLFWEAAEFERIEAASKNYRKVILIGQAKKGNAEASFALAQEFKDLRYLRELAARGDREAIFLLARAGDVAPLQELAARGDREAVVALGHSFEHMASIRELAAAGDLEAAAALARRFGEKEPLYNLAEQGNVDAAVELAEGHGDYKPLKTLADSGNRQAVAAFRRVSCQLIYYRADESRKPEETDKFVYVCEGDELATLDTVLISADWDKTYSSPPRRYFKNTPETLK